MATDREVREAHAVLDATFAELDRAERRRAESAMYVNAEHGAWLAARQARPREEALWARRRRLGEMLGVDREYREWSREELDWLSAQIRLFHDGRTDSPLRRSGLNALAPVIESVLTALATAARVVLTTARGGRDRAPWPLKLAWLFAGLFWVAYLIGRFA